MKIRVILVLVLLLALVACTKIQDDGDAKVRPIYQAEHIAQAYTRIYRFVDREYGYVCYVMAGGGIDCHKLEE